MAQTAINTAERPRVSRTADRSGANGMLIINADDWGGWESATDAALACHKQGRITSVSAMVFMKDSERAAALAKEWKVDVGLHVNLTQEFDGPGCPEKLLADQRQTRRFLKRSRRSQLLYNPFLRKQFRRVFEAQAEEFLRLYGRAPSHVDGHQHMHLSSNMLLDRIIPRGQKVRRSFSFWPGEKGLINRTFRRWVDGRLTRNYKLTDYFFSLPQCLKHQRLDRVVQLARTANVELMTHPEKPDEKTWLMGGEFAETLSDLRIGTYSQLPAA
jgi:chitin disaccharide deacetylase